MEYIAFMHENTDSQPSAEEWERFIELARKSLLFRGGSAIGNRTVLGRKAVPDVTEHIGGYMRFDSESHAELTALLEKHPTVAHGGTIEICEMPKT